jgi:hypothetical protein
MMDRVARIALTSGATFDVSRDVGIALQGSLLGQGMAALALETVDGKRVFVAVGHIESIIDLEQNHE